MLIFVQTILLPAYYLFEYTKDNQVEEKLYKDIKIPGK